MSNYPDDIHNYDNDPRSPFYDEEPDCVCVSCGDCFRDDEMANEILCKDCFKEDYI